MIHEGDRDYPDYSIIKIGQNTEKILLTWGHLQSPTLLWKDIY